MFRGVLRDLESLWKCCQKSVRPAFSPRSDFLCDNRALLSPFFTRESQCWWRGDGSGGGGEERNHYTVSFTENYSKRKKRVSAPHWRRADWSGRRLCLERSDLTRRGSLHPDALIKCHLFPNLSAFAETGCDFIYSVACPSAESTQWCEFCVCLWSETRDTHFLSVRIYQTVLFITVFPLPAFLSHHTQNRLLAPGTRVRRVCVCIAMTGYVMMVDHERWGTGTCLCRWFHSLPGEKTEKSIIINMTYQHIQRRMFKKTMTWWPEDRQMDGKKVSKWNRGAADTHPSDQQRAALFHTDLA